MDDIQLCKEITRLKKELQKLVSIPGRSALDMGQLWIKTGKKGGQLEILANKLFRFLAKNLLRRLTPLSLLYAKYKAKANRWLPLVLC